MDAFNPSNEDYNSRRNSYNVNVEDAGVALTGQQSKQDTICHFTLIGKVCRRGVYCKFDHSKPHELGKQKQKITYQLDWSHRVDCYPGQIFAVDVTEVVNPVRFYAHLTPAEFDEQKVLIKDEEIVNYRLELLQYIQKCCQSKRDLFGDNHRREVGEMVVAKLIDLDEWHRGRVICVFETKCEVYFVDFGYKELVDDNNIRDLPTELLNVHFLTHECCLAQVELNPAADNQKATAFLSGKLKGRNIYGRVADCKCPDLCLELYDITKPNSELKIKDIMIYLDFVLEITRDEQAEYKIADSELLPG